MFGSKAHFLDADPVETRDKIQLPQPDRAKDDTILYVHPVSVLIKGCGVCISHWTSYNHILVNWSDSTVSTCASNEYTN